MEYAHNHKLGNGLTGFRSYSCGSQCHTTWCQSRLVQQL